MQRSTLHLFFLLLLVMPGYMLQAQQYNERSEFLKANSVWTFGYYAGLDFNSGSPVAITDSFNDHPNTPGVPFAFNEGGASVADPVTGNLLFYFDGFSVRNKDHHIMPNGKWQNMFGKAYTTTQGSVIVPVIDSPGKYYLFTLYGPTGYGSVSTGGSTDSSRGFLFCSTIDMSLNNGLGDVVPGQRNIILDRDSLSESMIAVPGDDCDVWLLVHTYRYAKFKAYHITRNGVDPNPVVSETGKQIELPPTSTLAQKAYYLGGMAVSPDRQRVAISSGYPYAVLQNPIPSNWVGVLLCKFDPVTGIVSDALQVDKNLITYTVAFSPDNSKLYVTTLDPSLQRFLRQYDVSTFDSAAIAQSKVDVTSLPLNDPLEAYLKLYNGKIYLNANVGATAISVINQPNLSGVACDFKLNNIPLLAQTKTTAGLPNDVILPLRPDTLHTVVDTLICKGWKEGQEEGITLQAWNAGVGYTYSWDDGTTDSIRKVKVAGTYWVKYNDGCRYGVDTFKLEGVELEPEIRVDGFVLSTTESYNTYQWLLNGNIIQGATDSTYTVTENGDYSVIVSNEYGCVDTTDVYPVTNSGVSDLNSIAQEIRIYPNPAQDVVYIHSPVAVNVKVTGLEGKVLFLVENRSGSIPVNNLAGGVYLFLVTDKSGNLIKVEKVVKTN